MPEFLNNFIKSLGGEGKEGIIGTIITAIVGAVSGFFMGGPVGAAVGLFAGGLGGAAITGVVKNQLSPSVSNSKYAPINTPSESPLQSAEEAQNAAALLNQLQNKINAEKSRKIYNPEAVPVTTESDEQAAGTIANHIYSVIKTADDNSKRYLNYNKANPANPISTKIPDELHQFERIYSSYITEALAREGAGSRNLKDTDLAKLMEMTDATIDRKIDEKRKSVNVSWWPADFGGSILSPISNLRMSAAVKDALKFLDENKRDKWDIAVKEIREIGYGTDNIGWSHNTFVKAETREALHAIVALDDLIKEREKFYADRARIAKIAASEFQQFNAHSAKLEQFEKIQANASSVKPAPATIIAPAISQKPSAAESASEEATKKPDVAAQSTIAPTDAAVPNQETLKPVTKNGLQTYINRHHKQQGPNGNVAWMYDRYIAGELDNVNGLPLDVKEHLKNMMERNYSFKNKNGKQILEDFVKQFSITLDGESLSYHYEREKALLDQLKKEHDAKNKQANATMPSSLPDLSFSNLMTSIDDGTLLNKPTTPLKPGDKKQAGLRDMGNIA